MKCFDFRVNGGDLNETEEAAEVAEFYIPRVAVLFLVHVYL
jgi:hypothetical protein